MRNQKLLTIIIRLLEDCLDEEYTLEELRRAIREVLRLLGV